MRCVRYVLRRDNQEHSAHRCPACLRGRRRIRRSIAPRTLANGSVGRTGLHSRRSDRIEKIGSLGTRPRTRNRLAARASCLPHQTFARFSIEVLIVIVPQQVPRGLFSLVMGGLSHAPPPALAFSMHYPLPAAYFLFSLKPQTLAIFCMKNPTYWSSDNCLDFGE